MARESKPPQYDTRPGEVVIVSTVPQLIVADGLPVLHGIYNGPSALGMEPGVEIILSADAARNILRDYSNVEIVDGVGRAELPEFVNPATNERREWLDRGAAVGLSSLSAGGRSAQQDDAVDADASA
jgi:hypothetical protein